MTEVSLCVCVCACVCVCVRTDAMETDEAESVAGTGEDSAALQRAMRMARRADAQRVRGAMVDAAGLALTHLMQDSVASVGEPQSR